MPVVVDANIALAWVMPDEGSAQTDVLLAHARDDGIVVPTIWTYEMANILALGHLRSRITDRGLADAFALLGALPTVAIPDPGVEDLAALAHATGLTAYDAAYLWVAAKERLPLATLDRQMRDAAIERGIAVLP